MAGIQLSGLVSGLDTQSIIDQLMSVERQPRTRITHEQTQVTKRQSLLQDISTKLTTLKTANDDLKSALTWGDTQTVSSADESKVSVSRTAGAPPGGYDVSITQLASAERATYAFTPPTADGPLTVYEADGTTPRATVNLTAGATVDDAVAAINSSTNANLYAVNVNGELVLSAKTTGTGSGFQVSGAGAQTNRVAGQDAQFSVGSQSFTRSSNVVTDALPGVQLTLKGKTPGTDSVGITVSNPGPDKDAITTKVKAFIDAYNAVVTTTRADLSDKAVVNPSSTADLQKGTLFGDTGLSSMLTSLRGAVSQTIAGMSGTLKSLSDIGISTGAANTGTSINQDSVDGKLTLDTTKLSAALDADPAGVRTLLGGTAGTDGFSQAFASVLSPFTDAGGILDTRISSATSDLADISDRLTAFDSRMDAKQAYYQKQFTALETALQASQSAGSSLAGLMSSSR